MTIRKSPFGLLALCAIQAISAQQVGLHVALSVRMEDPNKGHTTALGGYFNDKTSDEITTAFTRELRALGDVRVVSPSEKYNERLDVLVVKGMCTTLFVVASRHTSDGDVLVEASTLGHMKAQWAVYVKHFDRNVLERDRKQLFK